MALTFGTLLSSQGADAHRQSPFGQIGGNPRNATPVGCARSIDRLRPLPTWSPHTRKWRVALGGRPVGVLRSCRKLACQANFPAALRRPSNRKKHSMGRNRGPNPGVRSARRAVGTMSGRGHADGSTSRTMRRLPTAKVAPETAPRATS